MTHSKDPGLTEDQFKQICGWLLIYAYVLLIIQILATIFYLTSVFIGNDANELAFLFFAALVFSLWCGNDRKIFFKRRFVNNGINGTAGIDLPFRHNVFWWSGWCLVEAMLSVAILYQSAKAVFG